MCSEQTSGVIPEQEPAWEVLTDLKEIVDIVVSNRLSEEA